MSAQESLVLEVNADKETSTLIEFALQNATVPYAVESQTPLKIRTLSTLAVVALLLPVLEEKGSAITGKATLPDGTSYEFTPDGLKAMKQRLVARLTSTPVMNAAVPTQGGNLLDFLREALKNPEATGKLVREVAAALRGDPQVMLEETKQVSRFAIGIMSLMALVIVGVSALGYYGKVSGDTVGIVYGTVIGSAFAFLYKYVAAPTESS